MESEWRESAKFELGLFRSGPAHFLRINAGTSTLNAKAVVQGLKPRLLGVCCLVVETTGYKELIGRRKCPALPDRRRRDAKGAKAQYS